MNFDLVILGSGSTAFAAAIRAASLGRTAAMTESRALGGTCVNRGCLPSKNLIEAARIVWESRNPRYPGLARAEVGIDFTELVRQKDAVIDEYRGRKYQSIVDDAEKIAVFEGYAQFVDDHAVAVGGRILEGERFLVATGTRPDVPPIAGLDQVAFLTSDLLTWGEDQELKELPRSLVIVGSGYVALELGQMFHRFGVEVTVLARSERLLPREEPEVGPAIVDVLSEEGIQVLTGATVRSVARDGAGVAVLADLGGRSRELRAERLLVATGRRPNTDAIGLGKAGVTTDDAGWIVVDATLKTSASHVYAAGDVIGPYTHSQLATPVGAHDGRIAAENALEGTEHRVAHDVIPRTIFTDPQVATVGLTEAEAVARGHRCVCRTVSMAHVPRPGAVRDTRGLVKMVLDERTERVLGVTMVARDAGEVIHEAAMGLRLGATVRDFADLIHVYPTMAEALKIVALAFSTDVAKLSCCAEG